MRTLLGLWILACGLRVGWLLWRYVMQEADGRLEYPDELAYWTAATSLASGNGLCDDLGFRATYMPLYPAFLALFAGLPRSLLWARLIQALLAALVAPAACLLGQAFASRLNHPPVRSATDRIGLIAGLIAACDPFLIFFSPLLLTEALFAVVLVLMWRGVVCLTLSGPEQEAASIRKFAGIVALTALGMWAALMLRPAAIVLWPAAGGLLLTCGRKGRRRWAAAGLFVSLVLLGLIPWAARNHQVIGQWRWLTTRSGISLYDGVRPGATGASDLAHTKNLPAVERLTETEWDAWFRHQAWEAIRAEPLRILRLAGVKFLRTWSLRPNVESHRSGPAAWVGAAWMIAVLSSAAGGLILCRGHWRVCLVLLAPVIVITLLHMLFVGSVRYRVPVMPILGVFSALALARIWPTSTRRRDDAAGIEAASPPAR